MNVLITDKAGEKIFKMRLAGWMGLAQIGAGVFVLLALLWLGLFFTTSDDRVVTEEVGKAWEAKIAGHGEEIRALRRAYERELQGVIVKVAELQARSVRLDALGGRVAQLADLAGFDFLTAPALGGPEIQEELAKHKPSEVLALIDELELAIESQEEDLQVLNDLLVHRSALRETGIEGVPVVDGWISSFYGVRVDPLTGGKGWHRGIDFAGKRGSDIVAVASGVVTRSNAEGGYGLMIEVNHGSGFVTRYAHNQENLVAVGDVVEKGQVIARMGSSGRSTGPHVHFEVIKKGRVVNPLPYIN